MMQQLPGQTGASVLLLSLVHPDLLPSLYSVSEVLSARGLDVEVLTFSSPAGGAIPLPRGVTLHDVGKYQSGAISRRRARRRFRRAVRERFVARRPISILAACPFSYLEALDVAGRNTPVVFMFYEMYDASWAELPRSPATIVRNWRALRRLRDSALVCVPSQERAQWLQERATLPRSPTVVLNCPTRSTERRPRHEASVASLLPAYFRDRHLVINTGGVTNSRGVLELVASVSHWPTGTALVITNVGEGSYAERVRRAAAESERSDDILLLPLVTRSQMLGLQRLAVIGTSFFRGDDLDTRYPAPNKIGEYLHAGLLVVASRSAATEQLASQGLAVVADNLTPAGVGEAIARAVAQVERVDTRCGALAAAQRWYCMEVQLEPVTRFIESTMNRETRHG
jgi:hypothetical protein